MLCVCIHQFVAILHGCLSKMGSIGLHCTILVWSPSRLDEFGWYGTYWLVLPLVGIKYE